MVKLLFFIPILPLACGVFNALFGMRLPRRAAELLAVGGVGSSALLCLFLWPLSAGEGTRALLYTWLESDSLRVPVEILFDPLSASMALMVTVVATLIHLYATGYLEAGEDYARFFALLNLFVFAMLVIVLADNLLLLFLGWEGVGFCSYGLIGYWYREKKNAEAGRKAFLVTRVGDVFLGIAILTLFSLLGTLSITAINGEASTLSPQILTILCLLLLGGACGKSAQLPLMTWLPDAMAGPTPVSALIHAATMVTAGVYLLCRLFPLVSLSGTGMAVIASVGAATALYAATCALAQREIKKVLAYSTMSQIGYMFLAVGAGTVSGAMFHLYAHAFFKALLFMGAGCIIHLAGGENDIYKMGGLRSKNPFVFYLFLAGALCLAGAPLTGGFFSKDGILLATFTAGGGLYTGIWAVGTLTALLTSLYTFRLLYLVFAGEQRQNLHPHELPGTMRWTLVPLAVAGVGGGLLNLPAFFGGGEMLHKLLGPLAGRQVEASHTLEMVLTAIAISVFVFGFVLARWRYRRFPGEERSATGAFFLAGWRADSLNERTVLLPFRKLSEFFWRGIDLAVIDGILGSLANGCHRGGEYLRLLTTGRLSTYLGAFAWGLVVMLGYFLLQTVG